MTDQSSTAVTKSVVSCIASSSSEKGRGGVGLDLAQRLAMVDAEMRAELLAKALHGLVVTRADHVKLVNAAVSARW